ncbi:putative WD repeat-containing protein 11 isoform X1 [Trypanosoma grayi]|uniref:putative WD repeat-containing protein 11 isoform X1 n=1 Tax=Trypanosoma grayi TaxID=71804 RepID=UPI0004F49B8B|nr:putative WD repeat-containing protein 11 isoform X1 [Trypanosoma grayi]KEG14262.1 putative WD repeat-containing protein 11 isoform X1 [Trypanosoma grayi]
MSCVSATLSAKIIPGKPASPGAGPAPIEEMKKWPYQAAQYGCQDLLACSSYCDESGDVFVVDMNSMQLVQTLHGHGVRVTCVQWKPPPASYLQHGLFLITGDAGGNVAIWDVAEGDILYSIQVPNSQPVHALLLLTRQHLLVVTRDCTGFVYDSHLADKEPLQDVQLPLRSEVSGSLVPLRLCTSKLSTSQTSCIVFVDRIRVLGSLEIGAKRNYSGSWAKDLIYDSEDGYETVFDAVFSESQEELLYFATRNSVGAYDWKTSLLLNEQVLWHTKGDVEFRRIFPSSPGTLAESSLQLPLLYSFGTDQRLCAWYVSRTDKITSVAADVRGARIASKTVANVVQSTMAANFFAVIFTDGSVARWRFAVESRRWLLEGYLSFSLVKPTGLCLVGDNTVCCALESGHLVLTDVKHCTTLRRVNIVHSGGTRIILLIPHRWGESVWVVTNKCVQFRHYHQVTLFDCRSGVVLCVLRKPTHPDATRMKGITLNATGAFLLLAYLDGTFEVWSVEGSGLIYSFEGMGVSGVSWAPQTFLSCLRGVQGTPQLLAIVFADSTMSFWTVYKDRVVQNRDVAPLLPSGSANGVFCVSTAESLAMIDGSGIPSIVKNEALDFHAIPLKNIPLNSRAISIAVSKADGVKTNSSADASQLQVWIAVVFADESFGVWNVSSRERLSYSKATQINMSVKALTWMGDMLIVLTTTGSIAVVDKFLISVNSSVSSKSPRRPIQSSAFFLPAHRTYIQTSLETQMKCTPLDSNFSESTNSPSYLVKNVDPNRRPCRGPFGQTISDDISTLARELDLYKETMIPRHIREPLQRAVSQRCTEEVALWVARFFGQQEKQRFWTQFCVSKALWQPLPGSNDQLQLTERREVGRELEPPLSYICSDRLSEAVAVSEVIRRNRTCFNEYRIAALEATKGQNLNNSKCRLTVARELLRLQEPQKAVDVLMDANYESDQFPQLANLAVTIAASTAAHDSPSQALLALTTKRAAAMFLARGDLDDAVEKFILSGDHYDACLTLQSCGKWNEAVTLAKMASMSSEKQRDLLYRWCSYCAKRGEMMDAARLLFSLGSPCEALVLLSESVHLTDVAGLLAIALLEVPTFSSREHLQKLTPSLSKDEDPSDALRLGEVVLNTLTDYCSVLNSVGNVVAERSVLELIASLKRENRGASTAAD